MRERPILFAAPLVRAILDGRKTQTRRVIKPQPKGVPERGGFGRLWFDGREDMNCPFGVRGDRLWVRETWMPGYEHDADHEAGPQVSVIYGADKAERRAAAPSYEIAEQWANAYSEDGEVPPRWRPSIHMPRWACRLFLEVTDVRVERLLAISEDDAIAEGIDGQGCAELSTSTPWSNHLAPVAVHAYAALWDQLNGAGAWDSNPWVWVIEFERVPT